ncbi:MAG TPA: relaxase, partial [Porphyromonadaceae bacterium]|nr:relaxase [Porphyromonadaceae bacterium]
NINRAYQDFKGWMPTATRTERPMVHISLNPHPEDVLTDAEFTLIAREYLEKMGFADMPYMVYKHSDI